MSEEVKKYIETALSKGASNDQITQTLKASGWSEKIIDKIIGNFSGVDTFGIPVPAPKMQAHQISRDLFVYFIIFVTLSFSAFAVGSIFFKCIYYFFSENLINNRYSYSGITWAIAQIIIAYPIFIYLSSWINNDLIKYPEKRESIIRKLMIYFILAIAVVISITDLTIVLNNFLKGELALITILNSIVVLGISLLIFLYYFNEVKEDDNLIKVNKKG